MLKSKVDFFLNIWNLNAIGLKFKLEILRLIFEGIIMLFDSLNHVQADHAFYFFLIIKFIQK